MHGLGDDQAEIMGEPVFEPLTPVRHLVGVAEHRFHPDLAARTDLDWTTRHVVRP